jgi:hypothetical protein
VKVYIVLFFVLDGLWIAMKMLTGMSMIEWINTSFLVGIITLIIGVSSFILQNDFLSGFFKGFQILGSSTVQKSRAMERADLLVKDNEDLQAYKKSLAFFIGTCSFLLASSAIFVSILGLFIF